jgi:hypothetical protein
VLPAGPARPPPLLSFSPASHIGDSFIEPICSARLLIYLFFWPIVMHR